MADKSGSNDEENPNLRRRRDSEEDDGAYQDGASSSSGARRPDLGLGHAQKRRGRGSRDEPTPGLCIQRPPPIHVPLCALDLFLYTVSFKHKNFTINAAVIFYIKSFIVI